MKKLLFLIAFCTSITAFAQNTLNIETQLLTGEQKLACEAILCLSSGSPPAECQPALNYYFNIQHKKLSDTLSARRNFLNSCPNANNGQNMNSLINALANGAGRCDVESLNVASGGENVGRYGDPIIRNNFPPYCAALYNHPYTDLDVTKPVYIGTPQTSGFWVKKENQAEAQKQYDAYVIRKEKELREMSYGH